MSYAEWGTTSDGGKQLFTHYELQVSEIFKGNASGPTIIMRELGGEKDGVGLQVPGTSQFNRGEDVVVLLRDKNPDASFDVQGMMMGKYTIELNENGIASLSGPGALNEHWTLDQLRTLIHSEAKSVSVPKAIPRVENDSATPKPVSTSAPQLHNSPEKGASPSWRLMLLIGIGIVAAGVLGYSVKSGS